MKYFNVAVVTAWLALFALSLRPSPQKPENFLDNAVLLFNEQVTDICWSCGQPNIPVAEYDENSKSDNRYILSDHIALVDNRMTNVILMNTFSFVVFVMAIINFTFYLGNGTIGSHLRRVVGPFERFFGRCRSVWRLYKNRNNPSQLRDGPRWPWRKPAQTSNAS